MTKNVANNHNSWNLAIFSRPLFLNLFKIKHTYNIYGFWYRYFAFPNPISGFENSNFNIYRLIPDRYSMPGFWGR